VLSWPREKVSYGMRLREDVSTAVTEYGMVLLDERTGRYWQLSPVGALVIEQLGMGSAIEGTVESITSRFEVRSDQARIDVDAFLGKLVAAGLVTA
jgi:hypothetical protein